jgi:hypothetical protein
MATSTPARRGRPTKLTAEVADRIVAAVRAGNYLETAANYAGVHPSTVFRWIKEGEAPGAPRAKREFCDAVSRARAESEVRVVGQIQRVIMGGQVLKEVTRTLPNGAVETERQFAPPDGKVALEFAARAYPDRWARRAALEVSGPGGGPVQIEQGHVIAALAERLQAHAAGELEGAVDAEVVEDDDRTA